jgi:hypothetical protein
MFCYDDIRTLQFNCPRREQDSSRLFSINYFYFPFMEDFTENRVKLSNCPKVIIKIKILNNEYKNIIMELREGC